jgi:pimeloyl-ACP methyl ester carboxylesterase
MIEKTLDCPGPPAHRLAYYEWAGPKNARTVLCLHGLTRNGRDFDRLAEALASDFRVICPDMAGRGRSAWLDDPMLYGYPLYLADMTALIWSAPRWAAISAWCGPRNKAIPSASW